MDGFQQPQHQNGAFNVPPLTKPPQIFGGNGVEGSPTVANFEFHEGQVDAQDHDGGNDENDAKRRRIARVGSLHRETPSQC